MQTEVVVDVLAFGMRKLEACGFFSDTGKLHAGTGKSEKSCNM
jgi:hypothetical protein